MQPSFESTEEVFGVHRCGAILARRGQSEPDGCVVYAVIEIGQGSCHRFELALSVLEFPLYLDEISCGLTLGEQSRESLDACPEALDSHLKVSLLFAHILAARFAAHNCAEVFQGNSNLSQFLWGNSQGKHG